MDDAWKALVAAGVPYGAAHRPAGGPLDLVRLRAAVAAAGAGIGRLEPAQRETLYAWLRAWQQHWPERFAAGLGPAGERCLRLLADLAVDPDRYLKLRRIAIANLAGRL